MLEPETACRHRDPFLKTECDLSGVLWVATANALSPIPKTLRDRLRTLLLLQPRREHFPVVAEGSIRDLAKRWQIDRFAFPEVTELDLPWTKLTSARQVRIATEHAVTRWVQSIRRH